MPADNQPPNHPRRPDHLSIRTIPSSDPTFDAHVRSLVRRLARPDPRLLQEQIRAEYPLALVRPRDLEGEPDTIWYVYRDGRWVPPATGPHLSAPPHVSGDEPPG